MGQAVVPELVAGQGEPPQGRRRAGAGEVDADAEGRAADAQAIAQLPEALHRLAVDRIVAVRAPLEPVDAVVVLEGVEVDGEGGEHYEPEARSGGTPSPEETPP